MFARMATVAASASRVPRWLPPVCLGLIGALLAGGVLSGGALRLGNTPLGARVTGIVTGMMKGTAARAPLAGPAPRRSSRALAVGLPQGCDPNTVNANTQLGGNNGNGLGDTRFFTYDAQPLDDRANLKLNVANGNLVLHLDLLHIKGTLLDEDVALFFNSQAVATVSEVGHGFVLSPGADVKLIITGGGSSVTFVAPSSYQTTYSGLSNGVYQDQPGLDATLISNNNGASYALNFHKTGECFAFNSSGQLTSDTEKNGHQLAFAYNGSGQLSSITDTQNRVTTFTYNGSLLSTITDPIGRTISFRYTTPPCPIQCPPATYLGSVTDAAGAKTSFGYDTSDRLSSVIDPRGNTTTIAYTSSSSLYVRTLTDPTGAATSLYYSVGGGSNPACPSSPAGLVENQLVDANTHATYYCYLPATDQVSAAFDALGHERQSSYTPDYNVATLIDPLTNLSTFTWSADGKNNLAGVSDATGAVTTFGYGTGNLYLPTRTTDPQGMVLAYTYDSPGNLTTVKDNTNNQNLLLDSYTYNSTPSALNGTLATATNGNGRQTTFGYDSFGNLTSVTPPSGGVLGATSLTYDGVSRVSSVTDGRGLVTSFSYDGDDRITKITYNDSSTVSYGYDNNGNVTSETDATGTTSFTYDKDNRALTKSQPNSFSLTYTYDPVGNLASLDDPGGTVTYAYDAANRLTTLTEPNGTTQVTFGYDNDDRRTTTTYPNGVTQTITYDGAGRELSVIGTHGSTTLTSFTYCYRPIPTGSTNCPTSGTPTNLRTLVTDGVSHNVTKYTYDTQNRLTEAKTTSSGGSIVSDYSYTYDAASNLTGQTAAVGGSTTTVSYIVDPDNAVTAETTNGTQQTFGYDGDGNLTSWSGGWSLSYNAKNQTTSVTNGGQSQNYTYSGPDQQALLSATSSAVTLQFANSALGETYQQGTDASYTRAFARDNRGALVSKSPSAGQYYFYLFDGLGSVAAVTDPSGNVAASYQYDPYGNVTSQTGSLYNPFQYASGWVSGITGFAHFGARWYAPATQLTRWTQQDPVAGSLFQPTSQCRYAYASDDPVNLVDPSGKTDTLTCILLLIGASAGIIGGLLGILGTVASLFAAPPTGGLSLIASFALLGSSIAALLAGGAALAVALRSGCL